MTLEQFKNILESYKKISDMCSELHNLGFDLYEGKFKIAEESYNLLRASLATTYNIDGIEWVEWFIYESDWGNKNWGTKEEPRYHAAWDKDDNPICFSLESLYQEINKNYKL
jgi:hypothetical protein